MKCKLFFLVLLFNIILGCEGNKKYNHQSSLELNDFQEIDLTTILSNKEQVCLSTLIDTITYIPISNVIDIKDNPTFRLSEDNIIYSNQYLINWNGQFEKSVVKMGQGRCEDVYPLLVTSLDYMYSLGTKIIQYDEKGNCINEKPLRYYYEKTSANFQKISDIGSINNNLIAYAFPDSLFWIDQNLEILHQARVYFGESQQVYGVFSNPYRKQITSTSATHTCFYHFLNDTVYNILPDSVFPKWNIDFGKRKTPVKYLLNLDKYIAKTLHEERVAGSELLNKTDETFYVESVYETSKYVIIYYSEARFLPQLRNMTPPRIQIAFYDKETRNVITSGEDGFIDDILYGPNFKPLCGVYNDLLVSWIWPFELKDYIKINEETVSSTLKEFSKSLNADDNPVLIIAKLK